jgi:bacillithiol system protein YtxJ
MQWIPLTNILQIDEIKEKSLQRPQVIFKHSTRCAVSSMAKSRLERIEPPKDVDFYYLDLIQFRSISNRIAEDFSVYHQSPQVLLIKNGKCTYDESHSGISMEEIIESI